MRIAAIFLSTVMITSLALSQISISSSEMQSMYAPGKSWRFLENTSLNTTLNIGTASTSAQTWTFPTITYTDTMRMDNLTLASTPYASKFPRATHVQRYSYAEGGSTSGYYNYYRITADSAINLGGVSRIQGSGMDTTFYDYTTHVTMLFPFTFGRTISSRDSSSSFPHSYTIHRSVTTCDAFGSMTTPSGTFQALRMIETSISQSVFSGIPFSTDTSVSYTWFTRDGFFVGVTPKLNNPTGSSILVSGLAYITLINTPTGVAEAGDALPSGYQLSQNYPNPFNPTTAISYQLPAASFVTLKVYDVLGKEVATLINGVQSAGSHVVQFDGSSLRSGVYFYRLQAGTFSETKRLVLIK